MQLLWKTDVPWGFLKKTKNKALPQDLAIPPLGIYPEKSLLEKSEGS